MLGAVGASEQLGYGIGGLLPYPPLYELEMMARAGVAPTPKLYAGISRALSSFGGAFLHPPSPRRGPAHLDI